MAIVVNPDGVVGEVPDAQTKDALAQGYTSASAAQSQTFLDARANREKYGTAGQQVATGVEGALGTASFGLSDWLERGLGISTPEAMAAREETNPIAHGIGSAVGIVAPALVGDEAGLLAGAKEGATAAREAGAIRSAARLAPTNLAAEANSGLRALALKAIPEGESWAAKAAREAVASGAGSAIEGAAYGAGNYVHEQALGDPNNVAESLMAEIGIGGALGLGLGALTGAGKILGATALEAARTKTTGVLKEFADRYPAYASKITGASEADVRHLIANKQRLADGSATIEEIMREARPVIPEPAPYAPGAEPAGFVPGTAPEKPVATSIVPPPEIEKSARAMTDALTDQAEATRAASVDAHAKFRPSETRLHVGATFTDEAQGEVANTAKQLTRTIDAMAAKPNLYPGMYPAKLEGIRDGLLRDTKSADSAGIFDALNQAKRELDPLARWQGTFGPEHRDAIDTIKGVRNALKTSLENKDVWGEAGARQASFNAATHEFIDSEKAFNSLLGTKTGIVSGRATFAVDPGKVEKFLSKLGDSGNSIKEEVFARYQAATRALHDEIEKSAALEHAGDYSRSRAAELASRVESARGQAHATHEAQAIYDAATDAQKADLAAYRGRLASFRGDEKARKALADKMWEDYAAKEAVLKSDAKIAAGEFKTASKAQTDEIKAAAKALKGTAKWNGFMDIIGAGAVGHAPILAPLFIGYRSMKYLSSPDKTVRILAALERTMQTTASRIDSGASTLVRGGVKAGKIARSEIIAGLVKSYGDSPEEARKKFDKRTAQIQIHATQPAVLNASIGRSTADVVDHAPNNSAKIAEKISTSVGHLASKIPQETRAGPLAPKALASHSEIAKFNRHYETAEDPISALKTAATVGVSPEAMETLTVCFPTLLQKMRAKVWEHLSKHPDPDYETRKRIALFMGEDLDGSANQAGADLARATFAGNQKPTAPAPHPRASGAKHIQIAKATLPGSDRAAAPV